MRSTETFDIRRSYSQSSKSVNAKKLEVHGITAVITLLGPMHF
ncbi:hypothetical protein PsW64_02823 [Pseudovibrio sp. W64]|nr:hypothetical protein PsW64_02823 [Pseudovibrio sp. W64]